MADFPASQERLLKQLVSRFRCSVCRNAFARDHVRVAARHDQLWIVSVRCGRCRHQQVFWIAMKAETVPTILGDLTTDEEEHFSALGPVTGDDVLDVHEFLSDFDGDFQKLFAQNSDM